ncbi:hypothetical protein D7V94_01725 [Parablautia intestinalis]|uniref:Uncharacterized protein n=1 Tax=Parablautia intestinalis TaxID=2320100 RepID=A0A3A9AS04_9FIRM|nr:hypothetical protein [Parablautia intestinalis]RKI94290.1 hypothetical protein D7V94_01725 [Parablautia intestinalis]
MKDTLVLKNGTELQLESGASLTDMRVLFPTKQDMLAGWDMLTKENLEEMLIRNADGVIVGRYSNLLLESETSTVQEDGTVLTSFHLREKTEIEILKEEISDLKESREINTGAIEDLGKAVSELAEQGGMV